MSMSSSSPEEEKIVFKVDRIADPLLLSPANEDAETFHIAAGILSLFA
jgi:hypothetical protein